MLPGAAGRCHAPSTNQNAGFVTVPSEKKLKYILSPFQVRKFPVDSHQTSDQLQLSPSNHTEPSFGSNCCKARNKMYKNCMCWRVCWGGGGGGRREILFV